MFCYNCGRAFAPGAAVCIYCGTPAAVVPGGGGVQPQQPGPTGNAFEDAARYRIPTDRVAFFLKTFADISAGRVCEVVIPNSRWNTPTAEQYRYCDDSGFTLIQIQGRAGWFVVPKT